MNIKPVMLKGAEQIKQFFDRTQKVGLVKTEDENLTVIADIKPSNIGGIIIKTPKATAEGGIYFKNEGLLQLTGDFTSKTESVREGNKTKSLGVMTVTVSADKTDEVLAYLGSKWGLGANTVQLRDIVESILNKYKKSNPRVRLGTHPNSSFITN
jgi:hypothetical protein